MNNLIKSITILLILTLSVNSFAAKKRLKRFGLQLELGVPQIAALSFLVKPCPYASLKLGGTTDAFSGGIITGLSVFGPWVVSPSLDLQGGYQFPGNANILTHTNQALLNHIGYGHLELLGGLNFGRPNSHFQFFLKGGLGSLWTQTNGLQAFINQNSNNNNKVTVKEVTVRALFPTFSLGFNVWF